MSSRSGYRINQMRVAIISDIHGNLPALEAVREHMQGQNVDQILCAGDFTDPFRESVEVWQYLKQNKIPTVRGNHEDYIVNSCRGVPPKTGWMSFNQTTVKQLADHFGEDLANELAEVPFEHEITFPDGEVMHLCHASFNNNCRSHNDEFTPEIRDFVTSHPATLFVSGHKHFHDKLFVDHNLMVVVGSLGLPLDQDNRAQYIIVSRKQEEWVIEHFRVPYDYKATIASFEKDDWLIKSGGMGLLMVDQILTAENRLAPFVRWLKRKRSDDPKDAPTTPKEWLRECINYLDSLDRIDKIKEELSSSSIEALGL